MMMMLDAGSSIAMHGIGEHDQSKMRAPKTSPSLKKTGAKTLHPPGPARLFNHSCMVVQG